MKSLYLINPNADFSGYYTAEVYAASGLVPAVLTADLAITTVAAMAPPDFHIRLCEEYVTPVDFDTDADYIGITGKITQWGRMRSIATEFRRRGKVVIFGGPYASLSPEVVQPYCDILIRGEMEEIAADFFADLRSGRWKSEYVGDKPDLASSPVPRWDLYPNDRAILGALQTSRGCPFECEFCDVIQYAGRKQRHKPPGQVLKELDELSKHRYRNVFLADDNFTVYRQRARELLDALAHWNSRTECGRFDFVTQVSIDVARDEDMLRLCGEAGVRHFFIGIETPNQESLLEMKKRQNMKVNLVDQVNTIVEHGIAAMAGMIVGFDHDGHDIFQRQYEFAMATPIPIFSLGALVAPAATPLHARMKKAGRLEESDGVVAAVPWSTNILPTQMTQAELLGGLQWLCNKLYDPAAFGERVIRFMQTYGKRSALRSHNTKTRPVLRPIERDGHQLIMKLKQLGPRENEMWSRINAQILKRPELASTVLKFLSQYMQIRHMYEHGQFWEPLLTQQPKPLEEMVKTRKTIPIISRPAATQAAVAF
jgi:radical SAM superfamily enzyme YgiQ (UPF0313 family)